MHYRIVKFSSVNHLSIFIPQNYGDESTVIYYIGLQGEWLGARRQEVILTAYEAQPNPADHKNVLNKFVARDVL
jgi:hypothetical protein